MMKNKSEQLDWLEKEILKDKKELDFEKNKFIQQIKKLKKEEALHYHQIKAPYQLNGKKPDDKNPLYFTTTKYMDASQNYLKPTNTYVWNIWIDDEMIDTFEYHFYQLLKSFDEDNKKRKEKK